MTSLVDLAAQERGLLLTWLMVLALLTIYCFISTLNQRMSWRRIALYFIIYLVEFGIMQVLVEISYLLNTGRELTGWAAKSAELPVWILPVVLSIGTAFLGSEVTFLRSWRLTHLTPSAIRESINNLPTGLCFALSDGTPLLTNRIINDLSHVLCGEVLLDAQAFWDAITNGEVSPKVTIVRLGEDPVLKLSNGHVWLLKRERLQVGHRSVWQITATETTRLFKLNEELVEQNERLRQLNNRLRNYGNQVAEVTRQKEILAAKTRCHDEMGQILVLARHCLLNECDHTQHDQLIQVLRQNLTVSASSLEEGKSSNDDLVELMNFAANIGLKIHVAGEIPGDPLGYLFFSAIRECTINAVRHAQASELDAVISEEPGQLSLTITNNGSVPTGPINEGGGLGRLRQRVADSGGELQIDWQPRFRLTVSVPVRNLRNG